MSDDATSEVGAEPVARTIDVLIVDDDDDVRAVFAMVFRDAGFTVAEAATGTDAFIEICRSPIRCVVLDVMMPGINGFDVLNALRSQPESWDMRVVVVTCLTSPAAAQEAWTLGADDYLPKPVDPAVMVSRVTQVLAASRAAIDGRRRTALERLATAG